MSKKGFDEFIIDNSLFDDTKSRNQTKFLSEKDNESIMLSVPTGISDKSMVSKSYNKKPLIDIESQSHDSGSDLGFSEQSIELEEEVFPASRKASFPEQSIQLEEEVFPPASKSAAAPSFPEQSIQLEEEVFPAASKSVAAPSFPEQSIQLEEEVFPAASKSVAAAPSFPEQSIQLEEEVFPPISRKASAAFPEQSIQLEEEDLNKTLNLDDAEFGGIVEESMPNCVSSISKPMFDDFSMSTIQLDDYKPTTKKNVGAVVNSATKIMHLPPTSNIEDLIENAANSSNKSVNLFLKMEKNDDHISISSISLSKENDKVNSNEMNISFDGKKGHFTVNNNGNVNEKIIETDSYTDFISKIYEPLMGRNNSISDFTIESGNDDDDDDDDEVDGS
jgi:hypothetical protein